MAPRAVASATDGQLYVFRPGVPGPEIVDRWSSVPWLQSEVDRLANLSQGLQLDLELEREARAAEVKALALRARFVHLLLLVAILPCIDAILDWVVQ